MSEKFIIIEQGCGQGFDYSHRSGEGEHIIFSVSEITGNDVYYLHRFANASGEKQYSAVYKGHMELCRSELRDEQKMLKGFLKQREAYFDVMP